MKKLKSGIVGLGQVGLLFDQERSRKGIWTHFSAYEKLSDYYELIAIADPLREKREIGLKRNKELIAIDSLETMLQSTELDVISICTPTSIHLSGLREASGKVRGIFCEKPICNINNIAEADEILKKCEKDKTYVVVNYYKRKELRFSDLSKFIKDRMIGIITQVNAFYSGPMEAVGSHAVDLLIYLFGKPKVLSALKRDFGDESPSYDVLLSFANDLTGHIICTGRRHNLIFEIDIIGEDGRVRVYNNGEKMEYFTFNKDEQYQGYKSLKKEDIQPMGSSNRFVDYLKELWRAVNGENVDLTCSGISALETQKALYEIYSMGEIA